MEHNRWMHDPVTLGKLKKIDAVIADFRLNAIGCALAEKDGMSAKLVCMEHVTTQLKGLLINL